MYGDVREFWSPERIKNVNGAQPGSYWFDLFINIIIINFFFCKQFFIIFMIITIRFGCTA